MTSETALILVDLQNDFLPGGALEVPKGDEVIPVANRLMSRFDLVVATQDWHPADHGSFASQHPNRGPGDVVLLDDLEQILWPDHCIQGSPGAEFASGLHTSGIERIFHKGTDRLLDSYSGFFDNGQRRSTGLGEFLSSQGVQRVFVMGLATDYCVKYTALDARRLGLNTVLVNDGCRGVELQPGDCKRAISQMTEAGVVVMRSHEITGEVTGG